MNQKKKILIILFAIITMISFACSSSTNKTNNEPAKAPSADANNPAQENSTVDTSMLEDSVEVPEGGFKFRPAKGYTLEITSGMVTLLAPGADPDNGPVINLMGMMSDQETSAEALLEQLQSGSDLQASEAQPIKIDGQNGLVVEISGSGSDADQRGKIVFAVIDGKQQFVMLAGSNQADWDAFSPIVDAVISSIEFIPLTQGAQVSNLASGNYAYTNRNVIRDLTVKDGVIYAATLGGLTTWRVDTQNFMQVVPTQNMGHISANSVTYCEIPEPRVLVGTLQGVSIYNFNTGQWEQKNLFPEDSRVATTKIDRLYCDQANHRLIVGYSGVGILDLETGEFQRFTDQEGLLWNSVSDITVNGKDIWVANGYKGIAKISNGQVTTFSEANGMPDEIANAIEFSSDGTMWVGAESGLMSYKNSVWKLYGSDSPANLYSINELGTVSNQYLWVATAPFGSGRLCMYNMAAGTCDKDFSAPDGMPILALATDEINAAFFGTGKGIYFDNNDSLEPFQTSDQLTSNYVDALAVAPDGMLWVGTDAGIQVLDPAAPDQPWVAYKQQEESNMGGNWASAIDFAADGSAWMSIINGSASRYQDNQWQSFQDVYSFNAVAVDTQNRAWFTDDGKGVIVLDSQGNQVLSYTTANGLPGDNVQAVVVDDAGVVWIGTDKGLAKYENNTLSVVFDKDSTEIPNVYIRALALDPRGDLLIGTFTGVSVYDGASATTLVDFLKDGYSEARLTTLACSSSGEVWIGTDKGVIHGNQNMGWQLLTTANGLLTNYISALTVDQFDTVWIGGGGSNFDGGGLLHIVP